MAKKGYNPDGSVDRSQTFTNGNTGVTTYADGSPAPSPSQHIAQTIQKNNNDAFTARGYDMYGNPYGPNPKYLNPKTGKYDLTSKYEEPKKSAPQQQQQKQNTQGYYSQSGAQLQIPTVAQRMSRMGQAVQQGVNKGSINQSQMQRYQVPNQAPNPVNKQPVPMPKGKARYA